MSDHLDTTIRHLLASFLVSLLMFRPSRPTALLIAPWKPWAWKKRFAVVCSTLGGLWLFLGPMLAIVKVRLPFPWLVWGAIVILSSCSPIVVEACFRRRTFHVTQLVHVFVVLRQAGTRIPIETSLDLDVRSFVRLLLEELAANTDVGAYRPEIVTLYEHSLIIEHDGRQSLPDPSDSLRGAGCQDGDVLMISGFIRIDYRHVTLSIDERRRTPQVGNAVLVNSLGEAGGEVVRTLSGPEGSTAQVSLADNMPGHLRRASHDRLSKVLETLANAGYTQKLAT